MDSDRVDRNPRVRGPALVLLLIAAVPGVAMLALMVASVALDGGEQFDLFSLVYGGIAVGLVVAVCAQRRGQDVGRE